MDSGFLAAAAGAAGKRAFTDFKLPTTAADLGPFAARVGMIGLMIVLNTLMISRYVKALEASESALRVKVINSATNFLCSIVFSVVLFDEAKEQIVKPSWWLGAITMILGVYVILSKPDSSGPESHSKLNSDEGITLHPRIDSGRDEEAVSFII